MNKIGMHGGTSLILTAICAKLFLQDLPEIFCVTGSAAWISVILGIILVYGVFFLIYLLFFRGSRETPPNILGILSENVFGKTIAVILAAGLFVYSLYQLYKFCAVIKFYALPETPEFIIYISVAAVLVYLVSKGLEGIVRLSSFLASFILASAVFALVFSYTQYSPVRLFPIWGYGMGSVAGQLPKVFGVFADVFLLFLIAPALQDRKTFVKSAAAALGISGGLWILTALCYALLLGNAAGGDKLSALLEIGKTIYVGRLVGHISPLLLIPATLSLMILCGTSLVISREIIIYLRGDKKT